MSTQLGTAQQYQQMQPGDPNSPASKALLKHFQDLLAKDPTILNGLQALLGGGRAFFQQQAGPALMSNPALKGITPQMIAPGQNISGGIVNPSMFSKSAIPLLLGSSLLQSRNAPWERGLGGGLDALAMLSMLGQQ